MEILASEVNITTTTIWSMANQNATDRQPPDVAGPLDYNHTITTLFGLIGHTQPVTIQGSAIIFVGEV